MNVLESIRRYVAESTFNKRDLEKFVLAAICEERQEFLKILEKGFEKKLTVKNILDSIRNRETL